MMFGLIMPRRAIGVLALCAAGAVRTASALDYAALPHDQRAMVVEFARHAAGLDAVAAERAVAVRRLLDHCRGPHARLARLALTEAYADDAPRRALGALAVLARLGDADAFAVVVDRLPFLTDPAVREQSLRSLPAFAYPRDETIRLQWLEATEGASAAANPALRAVIRQTPRPRFGQASDPEDEARRRAIAEALAGRVDPVADAMRALGDPARRAEAVRVVRHYTGDAPGGDPARWAGIGRAGRRGWLAEPLADARAARRVILTTLADFDGPATPAVLAAFQTAFDDGEAGGDEVALDALRELCRCAQRRERRLPTRSAEEEEGRFTRRGMDDALFSFTREAARARLHAPHRPVVRASGALALAAAGPPAREAAGAAGETWRAQAASALRTAAWRERDGRVRRALAFALGELDDPDATRMLAELLTVWPFDASASGQTAGDACRVAADLLGALASRARSARPGVAETARAALMKSLADESRPAGASADQTIAWLAVRALQRETGVALASRDPASWAPHLTPRAPASPVPPLP